MEEISVLQFDNYRDYLNFVVSPAAGLNNRPKTLEDWAKRLGYRSPSSLSMVLKGQRLPSHELVAAISQDLSLNDEETRYLQLLVQLEREKRKKRDVTKTLEFLKKIKKHKSYSQIDLNEFDYISNWYFLAIKNLVATRDFQENFSWISKKLGGKVTPPFVRDAIIKMIEIGVLTRDLRGHLCLPNEGFSTQNDIPSQALRQHQVEMMERAKEALEEVPLDQRQVSSLTFAINKEKISQAKAKILEFFGEFNDQFSVVDNGDDVYQLNIQFFPHAKGDGDIQ